MYEYILTKSVMLIFILGLVGIFIAFYNNMSYTSAGEIASSEAQRIAKQIDDIIGFKGVSNKAKVHVTRDLYVGKEIEPYKLEINKDGVVIVSFIQYPYEEVFGVAQFGLKITQVPGSSEKIECDWTQISNGAYFMVEKDSDNYFNDFDKELHYLVKINIDAAEKCGEYMKFEEDFVES